MKDKIKSLFVTLHAWQIILLSVLGAVLITDSITMIVSYWIWREIQINLILLGTINAVLVPLIILPIVLHNVRYVTQLEEQNRNHRKMISQLASERQLEATLQRRADELSFLHQLGASLASGKDLITTLRALQTEIFKLIEVDALFVAIYHEGSDIVDFPIFFEENNFHSYPSRQLSEKPGLTGAVIYSGRPLYIPDITATVVVDQYAPVGTNNLALHTFLGIPMKIHGRITGVISMQSTKVDAYSMDQIQLMENVAVQAAIAIDKANLLDQVNQQLVERKRAEDQLREREIILEAIAFAAEQFLKMPDWRLNIDRVLERLGQTLNATHAYLFEDHLSSEGEPVTSMRYEWTAPGFPSDLDGPYFQNSPIHKEGFEDQVEALLRGDIRVGNSSTFNSIERASMDEFGVKSILEVPILINEKVWGAIGFDDFEQEREWSKGEVEALKIAAGVLSAAIQREKAESAVRESERIYRQAIEAAGAVPYYQDYKIDTYQFMGQGIQKITGYTPEEMTSSLWNRISQEHELMGDLAGMNVDEVAQRVRRGELDFWRSDVRILTKSGQSKWIADSAIEIFDESGVSYASIGIMQDITERKHIEASLRQREAMLEATTYAAEQFLKTSDWRLNIDHVLERLGKTFHATHAYLFEHFVGTDETEYSALKYEWTATDHASDFDNPYYQNPNPIKLDEDSTDHYLRHGQIFIGTVLTFPTAEKERLRKQGVKGMVELPVFVDGKWWGTFGVDDYENEREWNNAEVDALKIAVGILGAAIQRQDAESAVRESERIYRQAIEAAGAVPYYRDYAKNSYAFMGSEIEKIIGYKPEEVTTDLWQNIMRENIPLGEAEGLTMNDAISFSRTGRLKVWRSDMRVLAKNGEEKWITDSAVELFDDSEFSYASIGIMQDVTDRKKTEAILRKRESILEAVTFAAEQFLKTANWRDRIEIVLERLGREMDVSHAYLFEKHRGPDGIVLTSMVYEWTASGCKSDLDDPLFLNMPPEPMGFDRLYDTLDQGEPLVASSSFFTPAEREYVQSIHIKAMLEMRVVVNGEHWGTIGFDDVSREREWSAMEVEVIKVAANVLGAAIKRQLDEAALHNELSQRTKLVEELENKNSELERFTYTVSHDLKSPLVTINGFLGFLEQDVVSGNLERLKKDTQRIQEAVNKMQRLLSELLELSRIGRKMNISEVVSFEELANEAMNIVQGQLEARGVTVHIQPNLPAVYGDKPRLTEVLQNLLDNATKYMGDQPQPHVEIGYTGEDAEHGQLIFYVKDNGIGIAPQFHERVFGLFNKLDPKSEGTGVGLALVKRIIEIHGGRIWIESELGQGSTFYITLPAKGNLP